LFSIFSFHPRLKRPLNDDEQIVKSELSENIKFKSKRRLNSSSLSVAPIEMQQQTTNLNLDDSANGIPSRFCSVCGDISTGKKKDISFIY